MSDQLEAQLSRFRELLETVRAARLRCDLTNGRALDADRLSREAMQDLKYAELALKNFVAALTDGSVTA